MYRLVADNTSEDKAAPADPQGSDYYHRLKLLSKKHRRPVETLCALAAINDPFYIGPARAAAAEWFAKLWDEENLDGVQHLRRIHYLLVSTDQTTVHGKPYENTVGCWSALVNAARDARYLALVQPIGSLIGRTRSRGSISRKATMRWSKWTSAFDLDLPGELIPPTLDLNLPTIPQRYAIEIWIEKRNRR